MMKPCTDKAPPGPSQELVSRIKHLAALLENLPSTLPLDPKDSIYYFVLDSEKVMDKGIFGAFGSCMEVCFETYKTKDGDIHFTERGKQLEQLTELMKTAIKTMSDQERVVFHKVWLERLIRAGVADGAKIPVKKRKQLGPIDLDKPEQSNQELDAPVR